jgi:hypothetical protein
MIGFTEFKLTDLKINTPQKIGIIGDIIMGKTLITKLINHINYPFNVIFSESKFNTNNKNIYYYDNIIEYSSILNHLIKYIDSLYNYNDQLIVFDNYIKNNYFLQKLYLSSRVSLITNTTNDLHFNSFHSYIFIFYNEDQIIKQNIYNTYFINLINCFEDFNIIYNDLNSNNNYFCLVLDSTQLNSQNQPKIYYLKKNNNINIII